jgi:hypothetical protein
MMALTAAPRLSCVANLSCVLMFAPSLCQTDEFHPVRFIAAAADGSYFFFANASFFE